MSRPYHAPWWLPGAHLQTIYPYFMLKGPSPAYRRSRWETPDGDFIELDWIDANPSAPLLALFHGLEGNSRSHYATALMRGVIRRGWRGVVVHFRGCSGEPNRLPRAYHSGDADEIGWILRRLREVEETGPLFAVGVSLGGNALLKWLAREQDHAGAIVRAAASISAPIDLMTAGDRLGRGLNWFYGRHFLETLRVKSLEKLARFPGIYDGDAVRHASTLRSFDNLVTAPLHGFRDTDDYWTRASSKPELGRIEVPTLLIHARNDPFLPGRFLPEPDEALPQIEFEIPETGGHVGFAAGPFPGNLDWLPDRIAEFFDKRMAAEPARH
jgi:predicted alpha/beta-fold hydrolase